MRVVYHIPNDDLRAAETAAREAEAAGFDGIVALENAHGPFPPLSVAAMATDHQSLNRCHYLFCSCIFFMHNVNFLESIFIKHRIKFCNRYINGII